jgi:hypothetical protein
MGKKFKQLETVFDLESDDLDDGAALDLATIKDNLREVTELSDRIDDQLANQRDAHDDEMDELAALAIDAHKNLQDLGMNVEIRHAGEIFASSSQMLKIAVDAKNNKVEKKLRLIKLQLDKLKLDRTTKAQEESPIAGTATLLDRNELLKQLNEIDSEAK